MLITALITSITVVWTTLVNRSATLEAARISASASSKGIEDPLCRVLGVHIQSLNGLQNAAVKSARIQQLIDEARYSGCSQYDDLRSMLKDVHALDKGKDQEVSGGDVAVESQTGWISVADRGIKGLEPNLSYPLEPPQYSTTTYHVGSGEVVVAIAGRPVLRCPSGSDFRLYWEHTSEYSISAVSGSATVQFIGSQPGKHLKINSSCLGPAPL